MSETISETAGKVVWFELPAKDTTRARGFYGQLFGWQFQAFEGPTEYHMTYKGGGAIQPGNGQKGPLVYFGTDDIDASEIPGVGRYSRCTDSEGNPFGLYQGGEA